MCYHLYIFYIIIFFFNSHEKSNTHHLEEPPKYPHELKAIHIISFVTYHASLALYWKKIIFYVFRTISVCMAIFLMELNLQIFSTGTFYIYIYWNTVKGRQTASTHIVDGIWECITPSHWKLMRWNILKWNTVIVCHNTYHSNSNSVVCCLEMLQTNN
jgi:hypothetical protein